MTTFCFPVDLNILPVQKEYLSLEQENYYELLPVNIVTDDLFNFLDSKNVSAISVDKFVLYPNKKSVIHTDAEGGDIIKINFIYNNLNADMVWYNQKFDKPIGKSPFGLTTTVFEPDEVEMIHKESLAPVSIVQVGVPHNIMNTDKIRCCISITIVHKETKKRITMEEAIDIFK